MARPAFPIRRTIPLMAFVAVLLTAQSGLAAELRYTVRTLPVPVVQPCFINDKQQVVGLNGMSGFLYLPEPDYGLAAGVHPRSVPTRSTGTQGTQSLGISGFNNQGMFFGHQYWNKNNVVTEDFNFTPTRINNGDQMIGQVQGPDWALRLATGQVFPARQFLDILPDLMLSGLTPDNQATKYQLTDVNDTGFILGT